MKYWITKDVIAKGVYPFEGTLEKLRDGLYQIRQGNLWSILVRDGQYHESREAAIELGKASLACEIQELNAKAAFYQRLIDTNFGYLDEHQNLPKP